MSLSNKFTIIIPPQDISCDPGCVGRLAAGDREAFAWIYKNYCRKVYDYALLMTGNPAQSDDIVQDVFVRLWTKREKLKEVQHFNGYLTVMLRNGVADFFQQQAKAKASLRDYAYVREGSVEQKDEGAADWEEREQLLQKAVEQLPAQQRLVYRLQRQQGLKREEIARQLHLTPLTVKSHIQHGLKFLKQYLKPLSSRP